jgi:hypothetical protein
LIGWLKSALSGPKSTFSDLERLTLGAVADHLPAARDVLLQQADAVNLIQRHAGGKEVNCYAMAGGKVRWPTTLQLPNRRQELHLATVRVSGGNKKSINADVHLVDGFLFSIEFDRSPETVEPPFKIEKVQIHADPMAKEAFAPPEPQRAAISWRGWLQSLERKRPDLVGFEPLPESERSRILASLTREMPSDYLELLEQSDGLQVGELVIFGTSDIRKVVLEDANYYMIGELDGIGALAVSTEPDEKGVFLIPYDRSRLSRFADLRSAVEGVLSGSTGRAK